MMLKGTKMSYESGADTRWSYKQLTPSSLIASLQAARIEAGISCEEAAQTLGITREVFDDLEAGKIALNLTEIRQYAYAVDAVIEYDVKPNS